MKAVRFWVGTGVLTAACVLAILAVATGFHIGRAGRVEGRVIYRGGPLTGGFVRFFPDDTDRCDYARGPIDEHGHYEIDPDWRREGPGRTRFRICVTLDPDKYPTNPRPAEQSATPRPDRAGAPGAQVVALSMGSGGRAMPGAGPAGGSGSYPRFADPATTDLAVELGPEPARVDIDLKD
jgi:hypothetical protein